MANILLKAREIQSMAQFDETDNKELEFSPVYSYTQKINRLIQEGKIVAPKYRTLSQEQMTSYLTAKDSKDYDRRQALLDLQKSRENTFAENLENQSIVEAIDLISGQKDRLQLAVGNMLVTEDYTPLAELGAEVAGYAVGEEAAKAAGRGWLAQTGAGVAGAVAAGAIIGALTPTELGRDEDLLTEEEKAERTKQGKEFYEQVAVAQLKEAGYTDEQIAQMRAEPKVQEFGRVLMQNAIDNIEYRAAVSPYVDPNSTAATLVSGAKSFGELALIAAGTKLLGAQVARGLKARSGKEKAVIDRYADIIGTKAGTAAATTEMSGEIMGAGALESVKSYIEETGDEKLENYRGDLRNASLDAYNTHLQNIIEYKLGVGRFIRNPRLMTKYGEWLNGFAQEFTQGEVNDFFEWFKGDQSAKDILRNIPQNLVEGLVGAVLQGGVGTGVYNHYHNQTVDALTDIIVSQSTIENPISESQARTFAEKKVIELEEGIANNMAQDIVEFTGATQYQGQIFNTILNNMKQATEYQRQAMKDTEEGSQFDDMTEDELAQLLVTAAQDQTDNAVIFALENKIPLAEAPQLKGETVEGTYYIEGLDYGKGTRAAKTQERQFVAEQVYEGANLEKDVKELKEDIKAIKEKQESEFLTPKEEQTKEQLRENSRKVANQVVQAITDTGLNANAKATETGQISASEHTSTYITVLNDKGEAREYRISYDMNPSRKEHPNVVATFHPDTPLQEIVAQIQATRNLPLGKEIIKIGIPAVNQYENILYKKKRPSEKYLHFQEQFDLADENARLDDIYPAYEGETIDIDGKQRTVYNSTGERIAKSAEALRNFYKWFGDSKVVDEQGRPLVVYHGTNAEFDTFEKDRIGDFGKGYYFTTSRENAEQYATRKGGNIVMPVYLSIKNIYKAPGNAGQFLYNLRDKKTSAKQAQGVLLEQGFGGIEIKQFSGKEKYFVAFEPNQIKSVDNRGTYDSDIGNIYLQNNQRAKGGAYDTRNRSITLGAGANFTTWFHEFAHYWIDKNFKWARSGLASAAWLNQWMAVEKWLGIDPEDKYLSKAASEKFARAYERFLGEEKLPLVLKKAMVDFRDFVQEQYDYELDDARGLQDKLGRPIKLDEAAKEWFRKSIYKEYLTPEERAIFNARLAEADKESASIKDSVEKQQEIEKVAQKSKEIVDAAPTGTEIQKEAGVSNAVVLGKKSIGGGEEKQSKGAIASALGKTYESTSWDIQDQLVSDYLATVSIDDALIALEEGTYPDKIDANFLRQALVDKLLEAGRDMEAAVLVEETADDFTQAAQTLQAARRINDPFTNAVNMLTAGKAVKLAEARYGRNKGAVEQLDKAMNALIAKYEKDFMAAETDEERDIVLAAMQDEAINTIGSLDKGSMLEFQTIDTVEDRKQAKAIRQRQKRRASISAYRSRAKRALKQALGLEPSREQIKSIKKLTSDVKREIRDYRKNVRENKASAIDPTSILMAQNKLNEYMNSQLPPRVLSTMADALNSYMMANMLWNPATNVFNIESTWVQMIPHMLATYINYGKGTIPFKEKLQLIKQALALQAKTGYNIFSLRDFFDKKTLWAEKYYEPKTKVGKIQAFPLTMLGLADTANKGIVFLQHADAMATKQAKKEGKGKERARELFYQALNTDPRTITRDGLKIREESVQEGEEATFTQMTRTAELVNKFRRLLNFGKSTGVGNIIMPFTTTISNIAEDTVKNYALGSVKNLINAPKALATQFDKSVTAEMKKEAWEAIAPETKSVIKNMIGVLMLLSIALSDADDEDYVLGYERQTDMDKDIRQNRNAPSGYAIRIGNRWIDLDLFGIGSPWAKAYLIAKRDGFTPDGWVKGIASTIDLVPGVSEIQDIYDRFSKVQQWSGEWEALADVSSDKLAEITERLIPAEAFFNEIGNITDTSKRVFWNRWYDRALSRIPGLRRMLPERTSSATGETIPQTDVFWNLATGQRVKEYIAPTDADKARYEFALSGKALAYREGNSKLRELGKDTEEYADAISKVRKSFTKKLESVAKTSAYKSASIDEKRKIANKLHQDALDEIKEEYGLQNKKKNKLKKK